jgi:hypothetical protein
LGRTFCRWPIWLRFWGKRTTHTLPRWKGWIGSKYALVACGGIRGQAISMQCPVVEFAITSTRWWVKALRQEGSWWWDFRAAWILAGHSVREKTRWRFVSDMYTRKTHDHIQRRDENRHNGEYLKSESNDICRKVANIHNFYMQYIHSLESINAILGFITFGTDVTFRRYIMIKR